MTDTERARATGPALEKMHQFLLWLLPTVEKLPRSHKFTLGDRIESTALDVLEKLIEATYTRRAEPLLQYRQQQRFPCRQHTPMCRSRRIHECCGRVSGRSGACMMSGSTRARFWPQGDRARFFH